MTTGVLIMTYGSPRDLADVGEYMTRVRGGRRPSDELIAEFQRRYTAIGWSPLVQITIRQAEALERALAEDGGTPAIAAAGMRFSEPSLAAGVRALADRGATRILGLVLSPQYSPILMGGYGQALQTAADAVGLPARMVEDWHLEPLFIQALANRVRQGLEGFDLAVRDAVPVLMTAHSMPRRVIDREPGYIGQLKETAQAVADAAGLSDGRWQFAYQSAGHSPEEWLKPDMLDVLPVLALQGHRHVLLAPIQFLADHLETLYDVDLGGREQAEAAGFRGFARTPAPNDAPDFARALAKVVRDALAGWDMADQSTQRETAWAR